MTHKGWRVVKPQHNQITLLSLISAVYLQYHIDPE